MIFTKKVVGSIGIVILLGFTGISYSSAQAEGEGDTDDFTEKMMQWEEEGIDPNHTEARELVLDYIHEYLGDVFAYMYIDRAETDLGMLVFAFTEEISDSHKLEMESFVEEPAKIGFREVKYTEGELVAKQREINMNEFEGQGISIYHTSTNIIGGKVEVGIDPFTEENAQVIYDRFGDEMIKVVAGYEATTLTDEGTSNANVDVEIDQAESDSPETISAPEEEEERELNFFQRIFQTIVSWFQ